MLIQSQVGGLILSILAVPIASDDQGMAVFKPALSARGKLELAPMLHAKNISVLSDTPDSHFRLPGLEPIDDLGRYGADLFVSQGVRADRKFARARVADYWRGLGWTTHEIDFHRTVNYQIDGRRLAAVSKCDKHPTRAVLLDNYARLFHQDVCSQLPVRGILSNLNLAGSSISVTLSDGQRFCRFFSSSLSDTDGIFSRDRSPPCVDCSSNSRPHCYSAQCHANPTDGDGDVGCVSRLLGSVRCLPLGAKIGLSIIAPWGAVGSFAIGFISLIDGIRHPIKGIAYFVLGLSLLGVASLPAW